ncbi:acyl-CoA thioesterase domain-containing protein [Amycolatopsis minnesotensis]|uniref:acyl-CoA thioesterase domain-containing protein n=1 Tax=Amycolatopsis minnesotensis TaxID=337894 RepID=UPI0031D54D69
MHDDGLRGGTSGGEAHPHPTAVGASFVEARAADVEVEVELFRAGRGSAQLRARLVQDGRACVEALLTQGMLGEADRGRSRSRPKRTASPARPTCRARTSACPRWRSSSSASTRCRRSPATSGCRAGRRPRGSARTCGCCPCQVRVPR